MQEPDSDSVQYYFWTCKLANSVCSHSSSYWIKTSQYLKKPWKWSFLNTSLVSTCPPSSVHSSLHLKVFGDRELPLLIQSVVSSGWCFIPEYMFCSQLSEITYWPYQLLICYSRQNYWPLYVSVSSLVKWK